MSKGRAERGAKIDVLREQFAATQGGVLTDYRGLDVATITELRSKFREQDVTFQVVKNTLTRLAVKGTSYEALDAYLAGPTAIAFSKDDAMAAAKVAVDFAKDHKEFEVKGGFMQGGVLSAAEVTELSSIGSRDQLLAQVLSVFNAPAQKFLGVINGIPQKFLGVLQAQADKLEEGA
jgi:large subunit ribosomal protein L10